MHRTYHLPIHLRLRFLNLNQAEFVCPQLS
jgi:hypothetical protein